MRACCMFSKVVPKYRTAYCNDLAYSTDHIGKCCCVFALTAAAILVWYMLSMMCYLYCENTNEKVNTTVFVCSCQVHIKAQINEFGTTSVRQVHIAVRYMVLEILTSCFMYAACPTVHVHVHVCAEQELGGVVTVVDGAVYY